MTHEQDEQSFPDSTDRDLAEREAAYAPHLDRFNQVHELLQLVYGNDVDGIEVGKRWQVWCPVVEQDGQPVIGGLWLTPMEGPWGTFDGPIPPGGVTGADLRDIPTKQFIAMKMKRQDVYESRLGYSLFSKDATTRLRKGAPARGRPAGPDFYPMIAALYLELLSAQDASPVATLALNLRRAGWRAATAKRVTQWVHQARERDWLAPKKVRQGKAAGKATEQLRRWIKENPDFRPKRQRSAKTTAKRRTTQKGKKR